MAPWNNVGQRAFRIARGTGSRLARLGTRVASDGWGAVQRIRSLRSPAKDLDDVTLARKVETELFRGSDAPKQKVSVNVADGVVTLRGEVKRPDQVKQLESRALAIPEVRRVENLLHLPKTPSPTRSDSPASQRRSAGGTRPRQRRSQAKTSDRTSARTTKAEPTPAELAAEGKGRQPAPLGSEERAEPQGTPSGGAATGGGSTGRRTTGGRSATSGAKPRARRGGRSGS